MSPLTGWPPSVTLKGMSPRANAASTDQPPRDAAHNSLDLILSYARQSYDQQVATLEVYRSRAGSLLAFAAVLVTLTSRTGPDLTRSLAQATGTVCVLVSAVLFLVVSSAKGFREVPSTHSLEIWDIDASPEQSKVRLLRHTLVAIRSNSHALSLVGAVLAIGLAWLLAGTILIGVRLTLLLL